MAELITGDTTKGIKSIGELALRISKFDSYRLFTLYENVRERKVMDVSGNHKYYLVFKSPKKEIRIPEYEPNGFFEVDKANGCILFKITKKNAEDILGMKTAGEKIFHIIRVFEERDAFGKVLSVTDEVEVYNGKWGDDYAFSTFTTENKVDLLTKSLAVQMDKNATQLNEYKDLLEKYNGEVEKSSDLEKELEALRAERDSLQTLLNEYTGNTYDGTLLSTDTKYVAFENTLDNVSFTEAQLSAALTEALGKDGFETGNDIDDPNVNLEVKVNTNISGLKITVYKKVSQDDSESQGESQGVATYVNGLILKNVEVNHGDVFEFVCEGCSGIPTSGKHLIDIIKNRKSFRLEYSDDNRGFDGAFKIESSPVYITNKSGRVTIKATANFERSGGTYAVGNIGTLKCYIQ
jgi:hypothetical protein